MDGEAELPDELWLEIFSFLTPTQASGVLLACRHFHALFSTPTLWRRFHERLVGGPLQPVVPDPTSSSYYSNSGEDEDDERDDDVDDMDEGEEFARGGSQRAEAVVVAAFPVFPRDGWRQALRWKVLKVAQQPGDEAQLVWAARLGCHRLVERVLARVLDAQPGRSALTSSLPEDEDSEEGVLLRMLCRALSAACWANSVLLAYGAAPVQCGYLGVKREAIVEAAEHGNVELMELLIAHGCISERWTFANSLPGRPLLAACWAGKVDAVECLLRHGVMCVASKNEFIERWGDSVNLEGVSPLCTAARRGHLDLVSLLLARLKDDLGDGERRNALESAAKEGRNDVIRHILTHGGVVGDIPSLTAYAKGKPPSFDYNVFEMLLRGVDAGDLRASHCWPIFKSKKMAEPYGKELCRQLLAKGANINAREMVTKWKAIVTPLAHAVAKDNVAVAETLLQCGADPNVPALGETTLLRLAQKKRYSRMVVLLTQHTEGKINKKQRKREMKNE